MPSAGSDTQMILKERDGSRSVTFTIAPKSIKDSRSMTRSNDADGGESPDQMSIVRVKGYSPRTVSFTAIFNKNYENTVTTPQQAAETLRQWQRPENNSKEPELKGNPPVLVFTGYDIMECLLFKTDFNILAYHPTKSDKIWVMEANLELVQYVAEETPKRAWDGLGGSFSATGPGSVADIIEERQRIRGKTRIRSLIQLEDEDDIEKKQKELRKLINDGILTEQEVKDLATTAFQDLNAKINDDGFFSDSLAKQRRDLITAFNTNLSQFL